MTLPIRRSLGLLAGELGVSLDGLDDEAMEQVALRFVVARKVNAEVLQQIVDDVRRGAGGQHGDPAATPSPEPPHSGFRFNATEADAIQRRKLAARHQAETRRTGLYLVPRRPEVMPTSAVHPACWAAYNDEGEPCSVCAPRLHPAVCDCDVCNRWWAEVDG